MYILDRTDNSAVDWKASALAPLKTSHYLAGYLDGTHAESYRPYYVANAAYIIPGSTGYANEYFVDLKNSQWISTMHAYIDVLASQGFDAVFIDNCDAYNSQVLINFYGSQAAAQQATISFLQDLRTYASTKYGMKLIANNGIELTALSGYSTATDGLMFEDIFNGQPAASLTYILSYLQKARALGKMVLDVEVTTSAATASSLTSQATSYGFIPYVTSDANYGTLGY
jgi:uncharacterized protein (TIGR01370 family)